ncbi:NO-inducible flavohemoprotein [Tistrella bauzanensis]|uniref:nitric oxide dioxygenase n=1 Tax=Tistrella arctica TaxID=3133430 RepID=A0ABU9YHR3_9PROT
MLTETTITLVKATVPVLRAHGEAITSRFYERLLTQPEIAAMFDPAHQRDGSQPRALAAAVLAYAEHIDNLSALAGAVERIAHKHVAVQVRPEQYDVVGAELLAAISDVLGDAATPPILAAWAEAYGVLAGVFIGREAVLADEVAARPGGWRGFRRFIVDAVNDESRVIKSFRLTPEDGGPLPPFSPGQYLTLRLTRDDGTTSLLRHYSLAGKPDARHWRIAVKREPEGRGSGMMHDMIKPGAVIEVAPPAGEFVLDIDGSRPILLLGAGVGQTPLLAMVETLAEMRPDHPVVWAHAAIDGRTHAFGRHLRDLAAATPGLSVHVAYERPDAEDRQGRDHDRIGRIDAQALRDLLPATDIDVYMCGPRGFQKAQAAQLIEIGVPRDRIRFELFGVTDEQIL